MRSLIVFIVLALVTGCVSVNNKKENAEAHYMLGISYLRANDPTQALKELLTAEDIEDDDAPLQAALGQAYFYKKSFKESEEHYLKALKLDKGNPKYQNNLAALYMEMKRWDEAIDLFDSAASNLLFATPEVAWTGAGYAWFMKGDNMKAIDSFIRAIELNPRYPQAYVRRGEVFNALGQPAKAIADYTKALDIFPDYILAHFNLAVVQMNLKHKASALEHFNRVIELAPDSELARQAKSYQLVLK